MKTAKKEFLASVLKKGERYAGIITGKDGEPDYHLILLAHKEVYADWEAAKKFAEKVGGELPTRREQYQLFANLKEEFNRTHYWSSEPHDANSGYARSHNFYGGGENNYIKHLVLRARAIRRVVI
jgi:hypothetical protein